MGNGPHPAINRAFELGGDATRITEYYDRWVDTYDDDVAAEGYGLPATCAEVLVECARREPSVAAAAEPTILDAGCGSGLIGVALTGAGYTTVDGVDLSPGMVEAARHRGVYRRLAAPIDLTAPPPRGWAAADGHGADAMVIGGVYTPGHLPPNTLGDMIRWVRPGGVLVVSVRQRYYDSEPYQQVSDDLVAAGALEQLVHRPDAPYTDDSTAHYFGYRVTQ